LYAFLISFTCGTYLAHQIINLIKNSVLNIFISELIMTSMSWVRNSWDNVWQI
jgi:hypothetical protein